MSLDFSAKLSETDINDFLDPLFEELNTVKDDIYKREINNISIELSKYTDKLKTPKFLKDNKKTIKGIQNHIYDVIDIYIIMFVIHV